jgi:thiamine transport system substrate-binding protein
VVENPATSSPGLAFLLATVEAFGEDGWEAWWTDLRANGVQVVDGWDEAYKIGCAYRIAS